MKRRRSFNTKRRICPVSDLPDDLETLAESVGYGGNPGHKKNPGDFGLMPPSAWRPDKALCDAVGIFERARALALLQKGIRRGMVSCIADDRDYPQNVWSVTEDGAPLEAELENAMQGIYHGYPLPPEEDPMHEQVLAEWPEREVLENAHD